MAGPSSDTSNYLAEFALTDKVYLAPNNYVDLNKNGQLDGVLITTADIIKANATVVNSPQLSPPVPVTMDSAVAAWTNVLKDAGDSLHRDSVDAGVVLYLLSSYLFPLLSHPSLPFTHNSSAFVKKKEEKVPPNHPSPPLFCINFSPDLITQALSIGTSGGLVTNPGIPTKLIHA